jgi:hypothetical protein
LNGLHASEARALADGLAILDAALPDNDNFTTGDATAWETRLGLITNTTVSLVDRKLAILRKMAHPGTVKARQNYLYLEGQLRAAGFDVYVYENRFPNGSGSYMTKTPFEFSGMAGGGNQLGDHQLGDAQFGITFLNKIANYIEESIDFNFDPTTNLRCTFFIGGAYASYGAFADIPSNRKDEFRQLILKIKPVHTCGFLLVNYT